MSRSVKTKPEGTLISKSLLWGVWALLTIALVVYFGMKITVADDKQELLIGDASHGHFQIELACDTCHTEAFGGGEVIQEACEGCHQEELKAAHDSHPKKKFTDPRNADVLEVLDARYCVSCHTEHQKEQTNEMGVTLPDDYCFHCHEEVGDERPSHQGLAFDSCATAGCHNYHDNRALYEGFLVEHAQGDWLNKKIEDAIHSQNVSSPVISDSLSKTTLSKTALTKNALPKPVDSHHEAGIPCQTCHVGAGESDPNWVPKAQVETCTQCHAQQVETYKQGKHGMRLAQSLDAVSPRLSELDFKANSMDLTHSCSSCHNIHEPDDSFSNVESCLSCHDDDHSNAYLDSPHGSLWLKTASQNQASDPHTSLSKGDLVTCATCHMPSQHDGDRSDASGSEFTQHNQNDNLRPNEKMIRPVCMQCHSLAFSIDALADEMLIQNNFKGQPSNHVPSIDWALEREKK